MFILWITVCIVMLWYATVVIAYEMGGTNHENVKELVKERDRAYDRYETYRRHNPPR